MKEHKMYVPFSIAKSFENARRFRDAVEAGDFSHDCGRYMAEDDGSISYIIDRCLWLSTDADTCIRMEMPGLVLLQYWSQAYAFARDANGVWHSCWVDEEFGVA